MQTIERINSTYVRHNWKEVAAGLAAGKTFIVENHGKEEARVLPPAKSGGGSDVDDYFKRVVARKPVALARVEINRGAEV